MGKNESTAINQLVDLVQRRPVAVDPEPADELMFRAPAPRAPAPRIAAPAPRPAVLPPAPRMASGTAPPPLSARPAAAWPVLPPAPIEPDDRPTMTFDRAVHGHHAPAAPGRPLAAAPVAWMPQPPIVAARAPSARPMFAAEEPTQAVVPLPHGARPARPLRHHLVSTLERFALPIALVVVIAGGVSAYLALGRDAGAHPAADAVALAAAPIAAAPTEPPGAVGQVMAGIGEAAPAAAVVRTVRIESTPPGATATLIASGGTTVLGTTPLEAALEAGQAHQIVLSLAGHVDHTATIDPAAAPQVTVALVTSIAAVTGVAPVAAAPDAPAEIEMPATTRPRASRHRSSTRASASRAAAPRERTATATTAAPTKAAVTKAAPTKVAAIPLAAGEAAGKGSGKLLVSANVAAMIYVDGRPTGLTTPQKLSLSAGPHKVTLLDASTRKAKTTTVEIEANGTAKLAREF